MRDAPSLSIVARLAGDGATIRAFDPEGMQQARPLLPDSVTYCRDAFDAAQGADALVLITEWNEFRALSPTRLRDAMRGRVLVDLRNVYDPVAMRQAGFDYHCVGRPGKHCATGNPSSMPCAYTCGHGHHSLHLHARPPRLSARLPGGPAAADGRHPTGSTSWWSTAPRPATFRRRSRAWSREIPNARLLRVEQPGVSLARNAGAEAAP